MGMYNEVFKSCPECGSICMIQIGQVVLGFGGFNLDDPNHYTIQELNQNEKRELAESVSDKTFYCKNEECQYFFQVQVDVGQPKGRVVI